jgi:hypothetical protein
VFIYFIFYFFLIYRCLLCTHICMGIIFIRFISLNTQIIIIIITLYICLHLTCFASMQHANMPCVFYVHIFYMPCVFYVHLFLYFSDNTINKQIISQLLFWLPHHWTCLPRCLFINQLVTILFYQQVYLLYKSKVIDLIYLNYIYIYIYIYSC